MVLSNSPIERMKEEIDRMESRYDARALKRQLILTGYKHQISFYGLVETAKGRDMSYRRIEIMSNTPITEDLMYFLYEFFEEIIPLKIYSIFRFNGVTNELLIAGDFE